MKKNKDEFNKDFNNLIFTGNKVLKLIYMFLFLALVIGVISIANQLNLFSFIITILSILSPLFIGFVIAWLFNPIVNKLQDKGVKRVFGSLIVYIGIIGILALIISLFIPIIIDQVAEFTNLLPEVISFATNLLSNLFETFNNSGIDVVALEENILGYFEGFETDLFIAIPENLFNIVTSTFSGLITFVLSFILGFYMLVDFNKVETSFAKIVPAKHQKEIITLTSNIGTEVRKCVNGILLIATMVFVCDTIGFAIVGLDAALLLGLFCGITDLIPYIGPYIGGGVAVLVGYTQGPVVGTGVLIIAIIVQLLENYVMQPVVMSKATNINPVIIMVSLLIFGHFFGIVGMILSTPILAVLKVVFLHFNDKYKIFNLSYKMIE